MGKLIIGSGMMKSRAYMLQNSIRIVGTSESHKLILDKLGIYSDFYPVRSGYKTMIILNIPAPEGKLMELFKQLIPLAEQLELKLYPADAVEEKLNNAVLDEI